MNITASILLLITLGGCCFPHNPELVADVERKRSSVMGLISLGMEITEAQRLLKDAGFVLTYREPIFPTKLRDYQQQLVVLASVPPRFSATFRYTTGMSPCPNEVRKFVVINANTAGKITRIW